MEVTGSPWMTPLVGRGRPTVGDLMSLCEENYRALMRLIPDLRLIQGEELCVLDRGQDLHLEVLEQTPFTSLLRLTYYFPYEDGIAHRMKSSEPDALLRVYHDVRQAEVLNLRQTVLPLRNHYEYPALAAKWKVNLFLSKWLRFCLDQGYRFPERPRVSVGSHTHRIAPIST
jgi:uncharacterized protein YqiB (DUF1249 family)